MKWLDNDWMRDSAALIIDKEVRVIKFRGDQSKMQGNIEVRGIVNKDGTISYGEYTQYDNEFGKLKFRFW